jgi:hypothetical protein
VTIEKFVPALRLPGGSAYRFVGGNRWLAAGALGAVSAFTIGPAIVYLRYGSAGIDNYGSEFILCAAVAFVIAEAFIGHRFRDRSAERTLAA